MLPSIVPIPGRYDCNYQNLSDKRLNRRENSQHGDLRKISKRGHAHQRRAISEKLGNPLILYPFVDVSFMPISLQWDMSTLPASLFTSDGQDMGLAMPCPAKASPRTKNRKIRLNTTQVFIALRSPSTDS